MNILIYILGYMKNNFYLKLNGARFI